MINRPPVKNPNAVLRAYYGTGYISNREIAEIFGITSSAAIARLKRPVIDRERVEDVPVVVPYHVNTRIAFEVWGIDVAQIEKNMKKLKELGL